MVVVPGHILPAAQELGHAVVGAHAGADGRHFQCQVVDVPGPRPHDGLHLGGGLHLEHAHGVAPAQVVEDAGIAVVDAAEVRLAPVRWRTSLTARCIWDRAPRASRSIISTPASSTLSLVPMGHVAAGDGRGLHRRQVGEGS